MHIAIEGLDGVGKTTTAKLLAKRIGFDFVEKPIHLLTDKEGMDNYLRITNIINNGGNHKITSSFYGFGNLYTSIILKNHNIVTDRHLASNYYWNCIHDTELFFDYLVNACGKPEVTIVIYASSDIRRERIMKRNPNDPDIIDKVSTNFQYDKIFEFVEKYSMPYFVVDNSFLSLNETIEFIITKLTKDYPMILPSY